MLQPEPVLRPAEWDRGNLAGGHVPHRDQVEPALAGRDVADVGQPDRVGPVGCEAPLEQVRCHSCRTTDAAVPEVVAGLATIPTRVVPTRLGIGCPGYHRK
jgi:hypothetical protein